MIVSTWTARTSPSLLLTALFGLALAGCSGDDNGDTDSTTTATTTATATATMTATGSSSSSTSETTTTTTTTTGTTTTTTGTDTDTGTETDTTTTGGPLCYAEPVDGEPSVTVEEVASGFDRPLLVVGDPSDPERLFVVEQGGHVKILEAGMTQAPAEDFLFIDVKNAVPATIGPEQGLLGFAFHPDYPADPRVYVNYNPAGGGPTPTYVDEFKVDPNDPNKVDPNSQRTIIAIHQPAGNHNGGMITFGPDGYLYIGMGDGGGANDAFNTGRDMKVLQAKVLRIDVEPDDVPDSTVACTDCPVLEGFDYTIPADNPFVGMEGIRPEIWASGLRNPWRMDFDRETGWLYMADVGQGQWEEISLGQSGGDFGWSDMEGNHCFGGNMCDESAAPNGTNMDGLVAPISEYIHEQGRCSVTGGYVYRGCEVPAWDGRYFYGDYCTGEIFGLSWDGNNVTELGLVAATGHNLFGSGIDGYGRVYFTTVEINQFKEPIEGRVIRIAPVP